MKNEKLKAAWDAAAPDAAGDDRMRSAVLAYGRALRQRKEQNEMKRKKNVKIWVPAAACLALLLAVGVFFGTHGFGAGRYTVTLEGGEKRTYTKTAQSSHSLDFRYAFGVTSRDLTQKELQAVSPLLTAAFGTFRADTGELIRLEGNAGETRVIMTLPGLPVSDTVVDESPAKNTVRGVEVLCGYCRANNGGKPVSLFSAEFELGGVTVYLEYGAPEAEAQAACEQFSQTVQAFIENGPPALNNVTE